MEHTVRRCHRGNHEHPITQMILQGFSETVDSLERNKIEDEARRKGTGQTAARETKQLVTHYGVVCICVRCVPKCFKVPQVLQLLGMLFLGQGSAAKPPKPFWPPVAGGRSQRSETWMVQISAHKPLSCREKVDISRPEASNLRAMASNVREKVDI